MSKPLNWTPAGPIAAAYEQARDPFAVITGPYGSGKTTAGARRCFRAAMWQPRSDQDVRYGRVLVVAPTYRALRDQVIPSFKPVVPSAMQDRCVHGNGDEDFKIDFNDGQGQVKLHVMFRALGDIAAEDFYAGYELTGVWVPNLDWYGDASIVREAMRRVNRYPGIGLVASANIMGERFGGVWGDCPIDRVPGWLSELPTQLYAQPAGFDPSSPDGFAPDAENVEALRAACPDFYRRLKAQGRQ